MKRFKSFSVFAIVCLFSAAALSNNYCPRLNLNNHISPQDPVRLSHHLLTITKQKRLYTNPTLQNELLTSALDFSTINSIFSSKFSTTTLSTYFVDWVRTQYFGSIKKNILSKNYYLYKKNYDLLTSFERNSLKSQSSTLLKQSKRNCTLDERTHLSCSSLYEVSLMNSPEVSCKKNTLKPASSLKTTFYLVQTKQHGLKLIDINFMGRRLVLDGVKHLVKLQKKGFQKDALLSHLKLISNHAGSFKRPKRLEHSNTTYSKFRTSVENRIPASL